MLSSFSLWNIYRRLGIPPRAWMRPNPFKIYEFHEVVSPSNLKAEHKVIDLGSGNGYAAMLLAEKCNSVIGIEPSQRSVANARRFLSRNRRRQVVFMHTFLEEADLPVSSFDRIYSFCVLEHIENLETVLSAAYEVLKPGGEIHVSVDSLGNVSDKDLITRHKHEHGVQRYFTPSSAKQIFESSGFEVMHVRPMMTGTFAGGEFEKRIRGQYRYGFFKRMWTLYRLRYDDIHHPGENGVMLIVRARRPV